MKNFIKHSLFTMVLSPLALGTSVHAARWDMNNNPDLFNATWHPTNYTKKFNALPLKGELDAENTPWGDSYWPKQRGAMSYRYLEFSNATQNQLLTSSERQRLFFNYESPSKEQLLQMSRTAEGREKIRRLSPLEKYSIYIGDFKYKLVKEYQRSNSPQDASWEGYCHAWSAAALHYPEPAVVTKTININGQNVDIPFGSADVKALLTANYADKFDFALLRRNKVERRQVGTRCSNRFQYQDVKVRQGVELMAEYGDTDGLMNDQIANKVREYQENALRVFSRERGSAWVRQYMPDLLDPQLATRAAIGAEEASCADTNAGAFHIVMANQIGLMKEGFQLDKTRDVEVWNQPAYKYESTILREERPSSTSAPGTAVVKVIHSILSYGDDTDYGWAFFYPTLAGLFGAPDANFMEEFNRYNQVLIQEGDEDHAPEYPEGIIGSSNFTYKLDIDANGNIIGGDWLSLDRPDFLWITNKLGFDGKFDRLGEIYQPMHYHNR